MCRYQQLSIILQVLLYIIVTNSYNTRVHVIMNYFYRNNHRLLKCKQCNRMKSSHSTYLIPTNNQEIYKKDLFDMKKNIYKVGLLSLLTLPLRTNRVNALTTDQCIEQNQNSNIDVNDIIKKPNDSRKYKTLTLENGLRVILVSDSDSKRAAAALDVHVGSFSDPKDIPGLAHFCEHMSFLGTEKYPKEDEFGSFLSSHTGSSNAYTDSEDTVYYFDIDSNFFEEALDRFAQFFVSPTFTSSATNRELNAIESEHSKNINNDGFRIYQIENDIANPEHPLDRFATGNKDTLYNIPKSKGVDVRDELLKFHKKYYSSNVMTLAVVGSQSLIDLELWVYKYFSNIPNRKALDPAIKWWGEIPPYLQKSSPSVLEIVPVSNSNTMSLVWPVWIKSPQERNIILNSKPELIISHLLGYEGKGSIRSYLVSKGWANAVQAAVTTDISDMQLFEVSVSLTDNGLKYVKEISDIIYSYIKLLSLGIPTYIYKEMEILSQISFNYSEKSDPSSYASTLSTNMQIFKNPRDYLIGSRLYHYNDNNCSIVNYLNQLNYNNCQLKVISKQFTNKTNKISKYYGTNYNYYLDSSLAKRWNKIQSSAYPIALPQPNDLIPTDFTLIETSSKNKNPLTLLNEPPVNILKDKYWNVWYKLDQTFKQPKVYIIILLTLDKLLYNPLFIVHSKLFITCFNEYINEYLYDANLAGLSFSINYSNRGLELVFSGFNDRILLFISNILNYLTNFTPTIELVNQYKELIRKDLVNWNIQQPYYHCNYYTNLATETLQYTVNELLDVIDNKISLDTMKSFLKSNLLNSYGEALIIGNLNQSNSLNIIKLVNNTLAFKPIDKSNILHKEVGLIPVSKGYRIRNKEPNTNDINSAVLFTFQLPSRDIKDQVLIQLLNIIVEQSFYNSLRTQQQLGYIVTSGLKPKDGLLHLYFLIQSSIVSSNILSNRIEIFLNEAINSLTLIDSNTLSTYISSLISSKSEPDQRLTSQAQRFWSEIVLCNIQNYDKPLFDRSNQEITILKSITINDFINFIKEFLSVDGKNRRLLVSEIYSTNPSATNNEEESEEVVDYITIDDERKFRESLPVIK